MRKYFGTHKPAASTCIGLLLFLIVGVEAGILLYGMGLGYAKLEVYDYRVFEQLAINLIDHATFSMDEAPPYSTSLFRSPGYPAYISLIYILFGRSLIALRLSQFFLLWLTAWLLYLLVARFVDTRSATVASLICATYPPFVFAATLYVAHSLTLLLAVIIVFALVSLRGQVRPQLHYFLLVGLVLGLMTLARPAFQLVALPAVAAVVMWRGRYNMKRRLVEAAVMMLGFSLLLAPWIMRNNLISHNVSGVKLVSAGGWSLYTSAQQYTGEISYRLLKPEWDVVIADFNRRNVEAVAVIPDQPAKPSTQAQRELMVDAGFNRDALRKMRDVTPGQFLKSYVRRFYWLWSTCDLSPWQIGIFHQILQLYHVLLMGLALLGCFLMRKSLVTQALLWLFFLYQTALHIVYHVEARYTLEARLFITIYAGIAVVSAVAYLQKKLFPLNTSSITPVATSATETRLKIIE